MPFIATIWRFTNIFAGLMVVSSRLISIVADLMGSLVLVLLSGN